MQQERQPPGVSSAAASTAAELETLAAGEFLRRELRGCHEAWLDLQRLAQLLDEGLPLSCWLSILEVVPVEVQLGMRISSSSLPHVFIEELLAFSDDLDFCFPASFERLWQFMGGPWQRGFLETRQLEVLLAARVQLKRMVPPSSKPAT
ncbi:hypothetical protein cyc_05956 [Cyclospora cayetanensis]|uniref:Uncharacterized protein n=1 Tax=Cyclospora cayetanensis TaxID=88456 RepID=A0A1D3CRJ7_9EIME|nr:hypothetical protein cyc_05956 [Cyclospora cayetanensis]